MKALITAGGTRMPIDSVRGIDNIFGGKTGAGIARYFHAQGAEVTLLTSDPSIMSAEGVIKFRTFDELLTKMEREIKTGGYDVVIHSAAPSDFGLSQVSGLEADGVTWRVLDTAGKISSAYSRLRLDLEPTIKIIDQIREPWGFTGKLIKFKLEVGITDEKLIQVATASMHHSKADFIVANCREWYKKRAFIISADNLYANVLRDDLPAELYRRLA